MLAIALLNGYYKIALLLTAITFRDDYNTNTGVICLVNSRVLARTCVTGNPVFIEKRVQDKYTTRWQA